MAAVANNALPSRRSSWSWRFRSRRNSVSEGPEPVVTGQQAGRNSFSAINTQTVESMRNDFAVLSRDANPKHAVVYIRQNASTTTEADAKNNRKSANSR
jgi:hypothetical protein